MKNPLLWSSLLFFHLDSPTFVGWGGRKLKSLRSMEFKRVTSNVICSPYFNAF